MEQPKCHEMHFVTGGLLRHLCQCSTILPLRNPVESNGTLIME